MFGRAIDLLFIDSIAFAVNVTLGTIVKTKLCNYSWDGRVNPDIKETDDQQSEEHYVPK
ncbi:hypothetical protein [Iningainema tapete]|uniref:Uncharacterized protein n=1 Tax=Iningainema tapete BLCC-T55 TaxID=2748662 RepID=A0A8J6Y1Y5_9CYAN|nr:hypothetical protein [Iningainema tapete]MBD2777913.1 hypothetical protein [Iningainema tapete BLCC-T55]